jgi:hypothetical protein
MHRKSTKKERKEGNNSVQVYEELLSGSLWDSRGKTKTPEAHNNPTNNCKQSTPKTSW